MSETRFNIVFDGALMPGVDTTTAKLNLAELFKSDVSAIERLFSGRKVALKSNLSQSEAQKYLEALNKSGIDARIEAEPSLQLDLGEVQDSPQQPGARHSDALIDPVSPYAPLGPTLAKASPPTAPSNPSVSKAVSGACATWPGPWS
ncbi:hypothetical protein PHLH5_49180 [Pseudomonas sp. Cab53]|nr:hypothetical protein PHLH5_49180 [Pseudomonas sp. Cab53]